MPALPKLVREMTGTLGPKVREAYLLAARIHQGEKRKSGEPYITHPLAVAKILFEAGADEDIVCAALLHDTLEYNDDAENVAGKIHAQFGDQVLYLVQAVSKDATISDKKQQQKQYVEQIRHALEVDIFAFFIKVADLLHNISTISGLTGKRREQWIHELKYQYLPIFSDCFHRVPLSYREMYYHMIEAIEQIISSLEENSHHGE